jgi:hypothetical protein
MGHLCRTQTNREVGVKSRRLNVRQNKKGGALGSVWFSFLNLLLQKVEPKESAFLQLL